LSHDRDCERGPVREELPTVTIDPLGESLPSHAPGEKTP
jgi:hypothetical protein